MLTLVLERGRIEIQWAFGLTGVQIPFPALFTLNSMNRPVLNPILKNMNLIFLDFGEFASYLTLPTPNRNKTGVRACNQQIIKLQFLVRFNSARYVKRNQIIGFSVS